MSIKFLLLGGGGGWGGGECRFYFYGREDCSDCSNWKSPIKQIENFKRAAHQTPIMCGEF